MYLHVLPCTCISRGTGLSGTALYLIVPISLPCTALYRLVSRRGQEDTRQYESVPEWTSWYVPVCIPIFQQDLCVGNMCSTCWYVPVHTSTYHYIPVHTGTYQYILVRTATIPTKSYFSIPGHTGMSWYVLVCGTHMYIPVCAGLYLSLPVHTSTSRYMYIPVHTCMY